jgi:hypothetical protein
MIVPFGQVGRQVHGGADDGGVPFGHGRPGLRGEPGEADPLGGGLQGGHDLNANPGPFGQLRGVIQDDLSILDVSVQDHDASPQTSSIVSAVPLDREQFADLARRLEALEKKYDSQFKAVFDAIRDLMAPPPEPKRGKFGFARNRGE